MPLKFPSFSGSVTCFLVLLILLWLGLFPSANPIAWDVFGYYLYLPATFIYDDLGLTNLETYREIIEQYKLSSTFYQVSTMPNGGTIIRYSMGMALLYSPFFFVSHAIALLFDLHADGFSVPYQWGLNIGSYLYTVIGLYFLRKVLRHWFSDVVTALVMLVTVLGTNYFHIVAYNATMPHNYLFTCYTLILWLTIRWHEKGKMYHLIALATACGLTILVRPSEILCLLIPLLWDVKDISSFKSRIRWWFRHLKYVLIAGLVLCLVGLPQFLYWKVYAGKFLLNSYNNPAEGLDLLNPHLCNFLFSFRKGWLIYTPVMVFAIAGTMLMVAKKWQHGWVIFVFLMCNLYLLSSWSNWWYADSFGQRSMVQSYVVLVLPMAFFISWLKEKHHALKVGVAILIALCLVLNLFQTWQVCHNIIHTSRMTFAYYKAVFGDTEHDPSLDSLLLISRAKLGDQLRDEQRFMKSTLYFNDYESGAYADDMAYSGSRADRIDQNGITFSEVRIPYEEVTEKECAWIRVSAMVYYPGEIERGSINLAISFENKSGGYHYHATPVEERCPQPGEWCRISVDYQTPEVRKKSDFLKVHFWQRGRSILYVDDLLIEKFESKQER